MENKLTYLKKDLDLIDEVLSNNSASYEQQSHTCGIRHPQCRPGS